jgi:hypothetical protein
MAVLGPTFPWYEAYSPAIAQINAEHVLQVAWADIVDHGTAPEQAANNAFRRMEAIFQLSDPTGGSRRAGAAPRVSRSNNELLNIPGVWPNIRLRTRTAHTRERGAA